MRINVLIKNLEENPPVRKYSIQDLAESVGYKNGASFARAFKNKTGISPSEHLKNKYSLSK